MNTVSLVVPLVLASLACAIACPTSFQEISGGCYHFGVSGLPMTWVEARVYCQNLNVTDPTDLATVANCQQFAKLYEFEFQHHTEVDFWIGGTDEASPGIWHWVTGELMPSGHPYWYLGSTSYGNCAFMEGTNGFFYKEDCDNSYYEKYPLCQTFPQVA